MGFDKLEKFKNQLKRVQLKYVDKHEHYYNRRNMLKTQMLFSKQLYNLKMKGKKIDALNKYTNQVIRSYGGCVCSMEQKEDLAYQVQMKAIEITEQYYKDAKDRKHIIQKWKDKDDFEYLKRQVLKDM